MNEVIRRPAILLVVLLLLLGAATAVGALVLRRAKPMSEDSRDDFNIIQGATLTLLALLIGFTLSMAVGRYDQRKNLEEEEANAIGTEYLRAELLESADAGRLKALLIQHLEQRVLYYRTADREQLRAIEGATGRIGDQMWAIVRGAARERPTPIIALVVGGMNDVLNSQGYTQAAWINRIPVAAWSLMMAISCLSAVLQGYGARRHTSIAVLCVLPLMVSLSLTLIADIDSPRGGLIRIAPQNLQGLATSLGG